MSIVGGSNNLLYTLILLFLSYTSVYSGNAPDGYEIISEYEDVNFADVLVEVNEPDKPAMVEARLEGEVKGCRIWNTYDYDYLSRDVVGMEGVPIEVVGDISGNTEDGTILVFVYDESMLACDEEDLGILWYNEEDYWYDTVYEYEIDFEKNEVTVPVKNPGTYILEDMKTWKSVWDGTYQYEDTRKEPECHWHNQFVYEDIEALADTSIYDESGEYHITSASQLAGLVKLVNEGNSFLGCDFYLDADIDLAGYQWVPIGWYYPADDGYVGMDFPFEGRFFGNGHAIRNMYIKAPNQCDVGMFGRSLQGFEVHDLALIDCYIEGKYYVGGILGDNINSGDEFDMTNCFVSGTVIGQLDVGALVGSSAYLRIRDCAAVMEDRGTTILTGDLRGGYTQNCSINDEKAVEALSQYK